MAENAWTARNDVSTSGTRFPELDDRTDARAYATLLMTLLAREALRELIGMPRTLRSS